MKFSALAWIAGAAQVEASRERWETNTFAASQSRSFPAGPTLFDAILTRNVKKVELAWYNQMGLVSRSMSSFASKMSATGRNYSDNEQQAVEANQRFWGQQ